MASIFNLFKPKKPPVTPPESGDIYITESYLDKETRTHKGRSLVMLDKKEDDGTYSGRAITSNKDRVYADPKEAKDLKDIRVSFTMDKESYAKRPYLMMSFFGNKASINEDHISYELVAKVDKEKAGKLGIAKYLFGK
jgi:hypothetical protein